MGIDNLIKDLMEFVQKEDIPSLSTEKSLNFGEYDVEVRIFISKHQDYGLKSEMLPMNMTIPQIVKNAKLPKKD